MMYSLDGQKVDAHPESWVAPTASVMGNVKLEKNASVWWGAVIRGDNDLITVGEGANIQDGSVLHTDPRLPDGDRQKRHHWPYGYATWLHHR